MNQDFDFSQVDSVEANGRSFTVPEIVGRLGLVIAWAVQGRTKNVQLMRLYILDMFLQGRLDDYGTLLKLGESVGVTSEAARQQKALFEKRILNKKG